MRTAKLFRLVILLMLGVFVLSACSPASTPVPPTATPVPPTATPPAEPAPAELVYDPARLKDTLGSAQTSYAGSISERAWNVELAAKRLDGTRVAPGATFSFNDAVGPTTTLTWPMGQSPRRPWRCHPRFAAAK